MRDIRSLQNGRAQGEERICCVGHRISNASYDAIADGVMDATEHAVPGTYSSARAGALWNYLTVLEDRSDGVHNPKYAKDLLQAAIDALKK